MLLRDRKRHGKTHKEREKREAERGEKTISLSGCSSAEAMCVEQESNKPYHMMSTVFHRRFVSRRMATCHTVPHWLWWYWPCAITAYSTGSPNTELLCKHTHDACLNKRAHENGWGCYKQVHPHAKTNRIQHGQYL